MAAIFAILGRLGAVLGDFFAPRSPPSFPRGALARPRALQEAPRDPPRATKVDLRRQESDPKRPKSTQGGPKARFWSDFGRFLVDFWLILAPKSGSKRLRRNDLRMMFSGAILTSVWRSMATVAHIGKRFGCDLRFHFACDVGVDLVFDRLSGSFEQCQVPSTHQPPLVSFIYWLRHYSSNV